MDLKVIVHTKMIPLLTFPQGIIVVYEFLISVKFILKKYPGSSKLYNGTE